MGLSGRRLTLTLAALLGVLVVVGAAAAFGVGRAQRLAADGGGDGGGLTAGSSSSQSAASSADTPGSPGSPGAQPQSTPPSSAPGGQPVDGATPPPGNAPEEPTPSPLTSRSQGSTRTTMSMTPVTVTLSARAEASPQAQQVSALLQRYFTAINHHDYDAWLATVSTAQATRDRDNWVADYRTTYDSDIYVSDINPGDPMTVRMQFMSHQSVELAPSGLKAPCVRWDVTYQILDEGSGLRVGTSAEAPSMAGCS